MNLMDGFAGVCVCEYMSQYHHDTSSVHFYANLITFLCKNNNYNSRQVSAPSIDR